VSGLFSVLVVGIEISRREWISLQPAGLFPSSLDPSPRALLALEPKPERMN